MAKVSSGSFNTTDYNNRYLTFSWSIKTQSIENNYSVIKWELRGAGSASGYYTSGNFKVVIAGETVYSSADRIPLRNDTLVASGEKVISHNNNGSQSFSASAEAGIYTYAVNCSGNATWDLTDIARKATITNAPNFTDEDDISITVSNPAGSAATLAMAISFDPNADPIVPFKTFTGTTCSFSSSELTPILNTATAVNSKKVYFVLRTIIGGKYLWHNVAKTFTVANCQPTIAPTVIDIGPNSTALTGNANRMIKGWNGMKATINATAKKGATITSISITNGSTKKTASPCEFWNTSNNKFIFTAIDSRGNKVEETIGVNMINYTKFTSSIAKNSVSTDGKFKVEISGKFFNGSFGTTNNAMTIKYRWRESGSEWGSWTALAATTSEETYSATTTLTGLDYQKSYDLEAQVVDKIADYLTTLSLLGITSTPLFGWNKSRFKHNTNVVFSNQKGIFGTDTEGNTLQSFLPCNANNNLVLGYGSYQNEKGNTNIYAGVDINLIPRGKITIKNSNLADFVVEEGSGGIWHWRKWYSGLVEVWGTSTITTDIACPYGSGYLCSNGTSAKSLTAYYPTGLFKTITNTGVSANHLGKVMIATGTNYTTEKYNYYIWCPNNVSYTGLSITVDFSAVGTWK